MIADRHAQGVHIIKTGMNGNAKDMPPEAYNALIDEAHKRRQVASHSSRRRKSARERRARRRCS